MPILLLAFVVGLIIGVYALAVRDGARVRRFCHALGFALMLGFAVLAALFIVGETVAEPGGTPAWLSILGWAIPLVGVSVWAWFSPRTAAPFLWAATAVIVAVSLWAAFATEQFRESLQGQGPILQVAALVVGVPAAVYGWHHPRPAAVMLLVVGLVPMLGLAIAAGSNGAILMGASISVITAPMVVTAVLYLVGTARPAPAEAHAEPVSARE